MKYEQDSKMPSCQMHLSIARNIGIISLLILSFIAVSGVASAEPVLTLNTYNIDLCPCSTSRVIGTLQSTPPATYSISADSSWATIVPAKLSLGAGESGNIYTYITPDCLTPPGMRAVKINAESDVGSTTATVNLNILECHGAALSSASIRASACIDDLATFMISVKNTGKYPETFNLSADYGTVQPEIITLVAGETQQVALYATPKTPSQRIIITATSTTSYAKKSMTLELLGENCYASNLNVTPEKQTVCQGLPAAYTMTLQNIGTKADTYALSSDFGSIGTVRLGHGEQKTIILEIPTANKSVGNAQFYVSVEQSSRPDVRTSRAVGLSVENCYYVAISAENEKLTVCPGMPARYTLFVNNTGKLGDNYTLSAERGTFGEPSISLGAGEKKSTSLVIGTALNQSGEETASVSVQSKNTDASASVPLTLQFESFNKCYDFEISAEPGNLAIDGRTNGLSTVNIKNTGIDTLDFMLKIDGPSWAYLDPMSLEIAPGQTKQAYVYVAPIYGVANGRYVIKVQATNNGKISKVAEIQAVLGNETPAVPGGNETPSGQVTGLSSSLKKTILLIVIGVIVIAAIIILPGMLSRKKEEPVELKEEVIKTEVEPEITAIIEGVEAAPEAEKEEKEKKEKAPKRKRGRPPKKQKLEGSEDIGGDAA